MGNLDRPVGQPDVPEVASPAKEPPGKAAGYWLNLDHQTDEQSRSALGLDRTDRQAEKDTDRPEAPGRHAAGEELEVTDHNDPAEIDYLAHDPRFDSGRTVIVGKSDSPDNPKRLAITTDDGRLVNVDGPVPDDPSGEELIELDERRKSRLEQIAETGKQAEFIENVESAGARHLGTLQDLIAERARPTGSHVGTPDQPAVYRTDREALHGGELVVAPIFVGLMAHHGVSSVRAWWHHRKQLTGDHEDAGN